MLLADGDDHIHLVDFDFIYFLVMKKDDANLYRVLGMEAVCLVNFSIDPNNAPRLDGFCIRFY